MTFDHYQGEALATAVYPEKYHTLYPALGLAGEAGEVANKVKKLYRDHGGRTTPEQREAIGREIGDVLWYCASLASDLGLSLHDIAGENLVGLASRREREVLHGSGDNR